MFADNHVFILKAGTAAELIWLILNPRSKHWLQRGRGVDAAESWLRAEKEADERGFKGAAVLMPRNRIARFVLSEWLGGLQRGRGVDAAESGN